MFSVNSESNHIFEQIKQEYRRNGRIELFINPAISFPLEQCYINLSIVENKEQQAKEKLLQHAQHSASVIGAYEEIYAVKTPIDVRDIFKTCNTHEKRVLVFGRAGIGKSTFCRHVAYQWAIGSYWAQYELLALIPLRQLTTDRYPPGREYSLIDVIKKELFPLDLTAKENEELTQQFDAKKTLWILDGYDEIVQTTPSHLQTLLEKLRKTPHHIITSRPYFNTLSYQVQMEIIGFTDENIENYVHNFFHQMQDEIEDAPLKSERLVEFLKSNPNIWGVAHVPVNLELICSLWSDHEWSETQQLTITRLYTMMAEWLCRRYLTAHGVSIQELSTTDVFEQCEEELRFVETLAFHAMKSNTILLRPALLKTAMDATKISRQKYSNSLNMGILKSVSKQGISTQVEKNKDHYFVHLSFQEYFAARYLSNALQTSQTGESMEFIGQQKYNQRYTFLLSFTAGLLSENGNERCLDLFWDTLLGPPVDLIGIRHMQLAIACMEEINDASMFSRRSILLEWIVQCLRCSFDEQNSVIRDHLLLSLRRSQYIASDKVLTNFLIGYLEGENLEGKETALSFIQNLNIQKPTNALLVSVVSRLHEKDAIVKSRACSALVDLGWKAATNEVISKLVSTLDDQSEEVRSSACKVLGNLGDKAATNGVISKLVSALDDESGEVRSSACSALLRLGQTLETNEVISKLVSALDDQSEEVRSSACYALGSLREKAATNEIISKLVSALDDQSEKIRSSACYALGRLGEKAATNEIISKLVSALDDQSEKVRMGACFALGRFGEKAATNEMISKLVIAFDDQSEEVRSRACYALGCLGEKAATNEVISKLVSALDDQSKKVRSSACLALGRFDEKAATNEMVSKLVSALDDESGEVRSSACLALACLDEKAATNEMISKLVSALDDQSEKVRSSACLALGSLREEAATNEVISKLVSALDDESGEVSSSACLALVCLDEKAATNEVVSKLVSALDDQSEKVRSSACLALGSLGDKAATNGVISKLVSVLNDQSEEVSNSAYSALVRLGQKLGTNEMIIKLVSALDDQSGEVRSRACYALGCFGEKAATNEIISKLVSALDDESEEVRMGACFALGSLGEKAATNEIISKLVSALDDQSEEVRSRACFALGRLDEKAATNEVISKLVSVLNDQSEEVRSSACFALVRLGQKLRTNEMISKLVSALDDQSEKVRSRACLALGRLDEKAATNEMISKLVSALDDQSEKVRNIACSVLGSLGKKAATNEIVNKVLKLVNDGKLDAGRCMSTLKNSLSSLKVMKEIDLCSMVQFLQKHNLYYRLENVAVQDLFSMWRETKDAGWLSLLIEFAVVNRAAVTATEVKMIVYESREPYELFIESQELFEQSIKAFTNLAERLHLRLKIPSEN